MASPIHMSSVLQNFIYQCDSTLSDLRSAYSTECMDACTSNYSFTGFLISSYSNSKNHRAADRVNALQHEACRLNEMLRGTGFFPLSTDFNGEAIRYAEEAEHNFLMNFFSSSRYSSYASTNTMSQLSHTISKVEWVRREAAQLQYMIQTAQMQPPAMPCSPIPPVPATCYATPVQA
jgi:hypothetical protein